MHSIQFKHTNTSSIGLGFKSTKINDKRVWYQFGEAEGSSCLMVFSVSEKIGIFAVSSSSNVLHLWNIVENVFAKFSTDVRPFKIYANGDELNVVYELDAGDILVSSNITEFDIIGNYRPVDWPYSNSDALFWGSKSSIEVFKGYDNLLYISIDGMVTNLSGSNGIFLNNHGENFLFDELYLKTQFTFKPVTYEKVFYNLQQIIIRISVCLVILIYDVCHHISIIKRLNLMLIILSLLYGFTGFLEVIDILIKGSLILTLLSALDALMTMKISLESVQKFATVGSLIILSLYQIYLFKI